MKFKKLKDLKIGDIIYVAEYRDYDSYFMMIIVDIKDDKYTIKDYSVGGEIIYYNKDNHVYIDDKNEISVEEEVLKEQKTLKRKAKLNKLYS